jgi:DNA-binding IclR family transcriptional regulator
MAGLQRYLSVLRLFDEKHHQWTVPELADALSVPASTVYRTVRDLLHAGFLESATEAKYRLGSFFVEFDRLVRLTDPLYRSSTPLLRELVAQARIPCVAVLARLYGDTVICIADHHSPDANIHTSYERGRPRPLMRGATSKVILAQLPSRRLTKLLASADLEPGPFRKNEKEFRDELTTIRKRGYTITRGEVDKGLVGIAAPVAAQDRTVTGSLSLVVSAQNLDEAAERRLVLLVVSSASLLTEELSLPNSREPGRARR